MRGQVIYMARHKIASNVCEKALITADPEMRKELVDEIMTPPPGVTNPMATMMKDQFASGWTIFLSYSIMIFMTDRL
jgi:pumilio RNA-binding family